MLRFYKGTVRRLCEEGLRIWEYLVFGFELIISDANQIVAFEGFLHADYERHIFLIIFLRTG